MTSYSPRLRRSAPLLLLTALTFACSDAGMIFDADPLFNKGGGNGKGGNGGGDPAVTAVDPSFGRQGQTILNVTISGSGFDVSAQAIWERNGTPDASITVHETRFVSASTVEASITIAADAELDLYDVVVSMSGGGKRGVGIEMFEVTTAQVIAPFCTNRVSAARGVNDAGMVVGHSCGTAFYWQDGGATVDLGTGIANDIDEAGNAIIGAAWSSATASQEGPALIWHRSGSSWVRSELPSDGRTARANTLASDVTGNVLLIGGHVKEMLNKRNSVMRPALWRQAGNGWQMVVLPQPAGVTNSTGMRVRAVNAAGHAAGGTDGIPVVWEPATAGGYAASVLPGNGTLSGMSPDGSVVVGVTDRGAAYWRHDGTDWTGPVIFHSCTTSIQHAAANAISASGLIVGGACGRAAAWQLDGAAVTEIKLGGLGKRDASQEVWGVSGTRLAGVALDLPVYWDLGY